MHLVGARAEEADLDQSGRTVDRRSVRKSIDDSPRGVNGLVLDTDDLFIRAYHQHGDDGDYPVYRVILLFEVHVFRPEKAEAEKRRLAEEQRKREEEQRRREAINREISGAFGMGDTPQGNEGATESGTGNQGSTEGNAVTGSYTGIGGAGQFDLSGRSLGTGGLQRPDYTVQEEGTIVVGITVDHGGNVINAEIQLRGTNIENARMRQSALEAARKTKFNSIPEMRNQIGTITYRYTLR